MNNDQYAPRSEPHGRFERVYNYRKCRALFRTNNFRAQYCCLKHKKAEANARYYEMHTDEQKTRAMASKRRRREQK